VFRDESAIVYLSYFDDSGSEPSSNLSVFGGNVASGDTLGMLENSSDRTVLGLGIPEESFEEFKAVELYFGTGRFKNLDRTRCRNAFKNLVSGFSRYGVPFIYSAIDRAVLQKEPLFGSAHPIDIAFQMCLDKLEHWLRRQHPLQVSVTGPTGTPVVPICLDDLCVVIVDSGNY
jgi:hypothetical protein